MFILRAMSGPKGARGRRFEGALDPVAAKMNASVDFDRRLLPHDVAGSIAHAEMLAARGILSDVDASAIAASFDRGVLEVRIPKPVERKPHRVEIAVGGGKPAIEGSESQAPAHA